MYERHFQLRERPFSLSPDPDYLYPSRVHKEALGYLRYGIEGRAGFVVITGEIGSGKTTLLQSLIAGLDTRTTVARLMNTALDPRELLDAIALDVGIDPTPMSKPVLLHALADFLVEQRRAGRLTLLIVDEAQNLSLAALEEIRMLSNLETEKSKLIQIVLIGQPELRDKLARPELQQLRQRITVSYHLLPLDADDTARYVNHRLKRAALSAPMEFPREVTDAVHRRSGGVPRLINVIADATLLFAYGMDRRDVDEAIVREALTELDATGVLAAGPERRTPSADILAEKKDAHRRASEDIDAREQALAERERDIARREQDMVRRQRRMDAERRAVSPGVTPPGATVRVPVRSGAAPTAASTPARVPGSEPRMAGAAAVQARPATKTPVFTTMPAVSRAMPPRPVPPAPRPLSVRDGEGFWHRVWRALFGVSQPEAGASR